jgi:hypothetical protein
MARVFASIVAAAALGICLVACQKHERSGGATRAGAERVAGADDAQAAAQRQSVIEFAKTLKDRMAHCAGYPAPPHSAKPKPFAAAWASLERDKESSCTQLMTDLGSGRIFPPDWPEDQRAKFRRALNTYAKYAAQNMSRSRNAAMFMESVEDDQDAGGEIERYMKAIGAQGVAWRDSGEKLFRQAARSYGLSDREVALPDS